jgi:pyruvate/2-oxoglutarate dehydrogenase complex dihydrolipoamide dehydrogenase (E3) component
MSSTEHASHPSDQTDRADTTDRADQTYDVVVVGAGAVGENAADRAGRTGLSVVVVEAELVGGECSYWACMPSKALLRPGAVLEAARAVPGAAEMITGALDPAKVLARRDSFTSGWDDSSQVDWLEGAGIALVRGRARLTGPKTLLVTAEDGTETTLTARHAVILATGSVPVVPPVPGLAEAQPWGSREATSVKEVPSSIAIMGGGVVGVEMATAFADLGATVTLVVRGERLLAANEPFAGDAVAGSLRAMGVDVRLSTDVTAVEVHDDGTHLLTTSGGASETLVAERLLVATGRRPATADIGVEAVGLTAGDPLRVDDAMLVEGVEGGWLFAVGDVTGRVATTHQGKYDARVAGDVVAARFGGSSEGELDAPDWSRFRATADHAAVPQVVFSRPEVASVGLTEQGARDAGFRVDVFSYDLGSVAGAAVAADGSTGKAQIVVDSDRAVIVGATFVGPEVAELLHAATIAVVGEVPLDRLWHAVPSYPTVSEVWLRLLEAAGL